MATGDDQIPPPRPPTGSATSRCESHREFIEAQLRLRRNATAIYQDMVDRFGFVGAYNSVKRFMAEIRIVEPRQFDRLEFSPGEEARVDYSEGAVTRAACDRFEFRGKSLEAKGRPGTDLIKGLIYRLEVVPNLVPKVL